MSQDSNFVQEALPDKAPEPAKRHRLPANRQGTTHKFRMGGHKAYVTVNTFEDGTPGEVFMRMAKAGSTEAGFLDVLSISVSLGLQYGVPLKTYCDKFSRIRFEPDGFSGPEFGFAFSVVDYIFRWLEARYVKPDGSFSITTSENERVSTQSQKVE